MPKLANLNSKIHLDSPVDEYGKFKEPDVKTKSSRRREAEHIARNLCEPPLEIAEMLNMKTIDIEIYNSNHMISETPPVQESIFPTKQTEKPAEVATESIFDQTKRLKKEETLQRISRAMSKDDLLEIWNANTRIQCETWFKDAMKERKEFLIDEGFIITKQEIPFHNDTSIPF